jgi:predicted amidophosphoribosyltransferase
MGLIVKNSYDTYQVRGLCGRCGRPRPADLAHCDACLLKVRERLRQYRAAHRAHYNATMRAWRQQRRG